MRFLFSRRRWLPFAGVLVLVLVVAAVAGVSNVQTNSSSKGFNGSMKPVFQMAYGIQPTASYSKERAAAPYDNTYRVLHGLFVGAKAKTRVDIAMYTMRDAQDASNDVVDQLISDIKAAVGRGVKVRLVTDNKTAAPGQQPPAGAKACSSSASATTTTAQEARTRTWTRAATRLWCAITSNGAHPEYMMVCNDACIGTNAAHNKFVLFEDDGSGKPVVFQSSANWTVPQLTNETQSSVLIRGNQDVYDAYLEYFQVLRKEPNSVSATPKPVNIKGDGAPLITFFPLASGNLYLEALNDLRCKRGKTVRIMTNILGYGSNTDITDRLRELQAQGCTIRVLVTAGEQNEPAVQQLLAKPKSSKQAAVPVRCSLALHAKTMILDAEWNDGKQAKLTFDGSQPFNNPGVSDNVVLRMGDNTLTDQYIRNFDALWGNQDARISVPCLDRSKLKSSTLPRPASVSAASATEIDDDV